MRRVWCSQDAAVRMKGSTRDMESNTSREDYCGEVDPEEGIGAWALLYELIAGLVTRS
jgi:hypothetical protein